MRCRGQCGVVVLGVVVGWGVPVVAYAGQPASLETELCGSSVAAQAFAAALQVELATQSPNVSLPPAELPMSRARIVACDIAFGRITLRVGDKQTTIDVSDVPAVARPRTAAVAVAETLRWWEDPSVIAPEAKQTSHGVEVEPPDVSQSPTTPLLQPASDAELPDGSQQEPPVERRPDAVTLRSPWHIEGLMRGVVQGPNATMLWGTQLQIGWRFAPYVAAGIGVGYLTSSDRSPWGQARLHAATGALSLDAVLGRDRLDAGWAQWRVGVGLESMQAQVAVKSHFGFDEPSTHAWSATADVHATLLAPVSSEWLVVATLAAAKAVRGVHLVSGGEGGFSLYGFGLDAKAGIGRWF